MMGKALSANCSKPVAEPRGHWVAATSLAPACAGRDVELCRQQFIACRLRGSLNALTLSLHVLERHGAEPQALEFANHVAQAAKRISALAKRLYVPEATGAEAPAASSPGFPDRVHSS